MANPNRDLGPCAVIWDRTGENIELNPTFGDVSFRDEVLSAPIQEDQAGLTEVDGVHTGRIVELTVPMTRSTLEKLNTVIKGSTDTATNLKVKNWVGGTHFDEAKAIIIKPIVDNVPSADTEEWLHIHRAFPLANLEYVYNNATQRITNVLFKVYPDDESGQVREMYRMGPA